jgi:hypothetical protein
LIKTNLEGANISGCSIYGISAWNVRLDGALQRDLIITPADEPPVTVDDLEAAQLVHLLLYNSKIRNVFNTITGKIVLIIGRFTPARKPIVYALLAALRQRNYLPVLLNYEMPISPGMDESLSMLAHSAQFIIADLTDSTTVPLELFSIVPMIPSVPVQPILESGRPVLAMFHDLAKYPWVLPAIRYDDSSVLVSSIEQLIAPAVARKAEFERRKREIAYDLDIQ